MVISHIQTKQRKCSLSSLVAETTLINILKFMKKFYHSLLIVSLFFISSKALSITHIITQNGASFSPQALEVEVGDVVRWVWTNGNHNTTAVAVPNGADTWISPLNSGNPQFEYEVVVAGTYAYVCTFHQGMGGGFVASEAPPVCTVDPVIVQEDNVITVTINGTGAANPLYGIDWGDGSMASNQPTDTHTYLEVGDYEVCVVYLDQNNPTGCTVPSCSTVEIDFVPGVECHVELTVSLTDATVTASAVGTGVENGQYIIDWGDDTSFNGQEATHTYSESGSYTICVLYGDMSPNGCTDDSCETIDVNIVEPVECTLQIMASSVGGLNVILTSNGTGAENPQYSVDWGDGSTLGVNPNGTHEYTEDGEYTICVTYSDIDNLENCTVVQCTNIEVSSSSGTCTVVLTLTNDGDTYTATVVGTGADSPQYAINWGDGSTPTIGNNGNHTYTEPGEYEVCGYYTDLLNAANCTVFDCEDVQIAVGIVENNVLLSQLAVVPNPVSDDAQIVFSLDKASEIQIDVLDVLGKIIETPMKGIRPQGLQRVSWNTDALASGVYHVRVTSGMDQQVVRITK